MLDFFIPLLLGIVSFSLFIFVLPILDQRRNKKENRKEITEQSITNLILLLKDAIRSGNIKNHQQLKTVLVGSDEYESIVKNSPDNPKLPYFSLYILEKLRSILSRYSNSPKEKERIEVVDDLISEVKILVTKKEEEDPFKKLPEKEKEFILDIISHHNISNEDYSMRKLKSLGDLISVREDTMSELTKSNEESLALAKKSMFYTKIFFGITMAASIFSIWDEIISWFQ